MRDVVDAHEVLDVLEEARVRSELEAEAKMQAPKRQARR
jgi:hypothetical protein